VLGKGNGRSIKPSRDTSRNNETEAVVTETGIALVHEGERIRPRREDEAQFEPASSSDTVVVNLPVIVQIHGRHDGAETDRIVSETIRRLRMAVESEGSLE
jgi:hypothetical protein